jgi:hypothetical protein
MVISWLGRRNGGFSEAPKSELRSSLERGGLVERIGAGHLFATIGTAIEAFHRMEVLEQAS